MSDEVAYHTRYEDGTDFVWDKMWEYVWPMDSPHVVTFSVETLTRFEDIPFDIDLEKIAAYSGLNEKFYAGLFKFGADSSYVTYRQSLAGTRRMWVRIASEDVEAVEKLQFAILTNVAPIEQAEDAVKVKFWHWAGSAPDYNVRHLDAPLWDDIKINYSPKAKESLEELIHLKPEDITGGRLAIVHGPPGTGKTTMLRALCREWKTWCSIDYIVDPEQFFGNAMYMTNCLMAPSHDIDPYDEDNEDDDAIFAMLNKADSTEFQFPGRGSRIMPQEKASNAGAWRLLIIEDAEEFLNPQAKEHVGQALSRLLNVSDGFIGQGLNILILMTTNIQMTDVHEAVKRPGRTFANIEVPKLTGREASKWLDAPVEEDLSLAELFEKKNHVQIGSGVTQVEVPGQYL